jgi:hypothetical protein
MAQKYMKSTGNPINGLQADRRTGVDKFQMYERAPVLLTGSNELIDGTIFRFSCITEDEWLVTLI